MYKSYKFYLLWGLSDVNITKTVVDSVLGKIMDVFISTYFKERLELMNKLIEVSNIKIQSIKGHTPKNVRNKHHKI